MTTDELLLEKRIAAELDVDLSNPPVHPEELLNYPEPAPLLGHPPSTRLLLEGFDSDEITADFLVEIHDLAGEHDLDLDGISVGRPE